MKAKAKRTAKKTSKARGAKKSRKAGTARKASVKAVGREALLDKVYKAVVKHQRAPDSVLFETITRAANKVSKFDSGNKAI